jgi:hypothetical protein
MPQAIFEVLFEVIFQVISGVTGEVILWIVTLGRRKPQIEKAGDLSTLIGLFFWVLIGIGVAMFFIL